MLFLLMSTLSLESIGRSFFFPLGSPIMAVPSPMRRMTLWPCSMNLFRQITGRSEPMCREAAVGSTPR
jgi:hypothetical protein